jgi:hypothetical protein
MSFATKAAILGAFVASTLAHGTVQSFFTDGAFNQGFLLDYYYMGQNGQTPPTHYGWYAENLDNGFVEPSNYGSPDIICHKNAKPSPFTAKVAAGGKVDFQWTAWPESHMGPVITYMANCNGDCAAVDKTALKFFKIDEAGYDASSKSWAAVDMIVNNNTWTVTVPSNVAAGNYVFRHEIIALHGAGSENGAQNYPQCVNIEVTGSGTENPEGVLGTELYTSKDAGILFNPYTTIESYEIPGPALVGGGSPSNPTPSKPASSSTPTPTASAAASTSAATTQPTATASPTSAPAPAPSQGDNNNVDNGNDSPDALPKTFTLDTFIAWLQKQADNGGAKRRHARDF